ncbi:ORF61 [callitrichine gammaherpesvirus 3]|uniref:ORF61 n=1 Tax=callitrichine gammaherpesvirus 3 TaxID=106331 RepID=Q8BEN5_9GAMA|nr:ORF61 [callitrichine gammaherpesvirus 3]AAN64282.1 ORF61 [callitrichine gammaherpesvirus 3]
MQDRGQKFIDDLNNIIVSFLGDSETLEVERCTDMHALSKGSSHPICVVKLRHGKIYHLEFVYKFLAFKLRCEKYPSSPVFVISNNGMAATLKCFLGEPSGLREQQGGTSLVKLATDVDLPKNYMIVIGQDDFIKFKSPFVFARDLHTLRSMVVCRAYLTEQRTTIQFLVLQSGNEHKTSGVLDIIRKMGRPWSCDMTLRDESSISGEEARGGEPFEYGGSGDQQRPRCSGKADVYGDDYDSLSESDDHQFSRLIRRPIRKKPKRGNERLVKSVEQHVDISSSNRFSVYKVRSVVLVLGLVAVLLFFRIFAV